ncbi:MAG: DNA recombination protein RmuC [Acidimicrobiia bacterium]
MSTLSLIVIAVALMVVLVLGIGAGLVIAARARSRAPSSAHPSQQAALNEAIARLEARATQGATAAIRDQMVETRLAEVQTELRGELSRVADMLAGLKAASHESMLQLGAQLSVHASSTRELALTTGQLREALASTKTRGQWGERMAEDVLHLAGFVEHINYVKQTANDDRSGIPDFTFLLPKGHKLFMDVKFPLSSYLRVLDASSDVERAAHRKQFLTDVRLRVRELAKRSYAADEHALNDVLLFIPNETVTAYIHEHDPALVDDALAQHIVFCSPLTLFAMLGVIRQAYDNFMVEQQADQILGLVSRFKTQWNRYTNQLDKIDRGFVSVAKAFAELQTTRRNQLDRVINQIEGVSAERGMLAGSDDESARDAIEGVTDDVESLTFT